MATFLTPVQNSLFGDAPPAARPPHLESRDAAGKNVVQKLLKVRKSLTGAELDYLPDINAAIESIRTKLRATDPQRYEAVLYAIERSGATTITEIAEDTRLSAATVKEIVAELLKNGTLYNAARYIPGNDRPRYMLKSNRLKTPEAV